MQNRILIQMLMALAMTFGAQTAANAQFGKLKGLADKAKSAVKDKAASTVGSATGNAASQAASTVGVAGGGSGDGELMSNGTPVKWSWEDKIKQYYEGMHWGGSKSDAYNSQLLWLYEFAGKIIQDQDFFFGTTCSGAWMNLEGNKHVPYDEPLRYAWTKNFVDDPTFNNWICFCYVLPFQCVNWYGHYRYCMDDYGSGVIIGSKNMMLAWPSEQKMLDERNAREEYAIKLAWEKIPVDKACEYAMFLLKQVRDAYAKGNVKIDRVWQLYQAIAIKDVMIERRPDYEKKWRDNDKVRELQAAFITPRLFTGEPYKGQFFDIVNAYRNGNMDKKSVPQGVAVDAATKNGGTSAGKTSAQNFGEQFVEVIYKSKEWSAFKNPKYPYNVTHHSLPVSLITKKGTQYIMRNGTLQRTPAGKYQIQIAMDGTASGVPVDYKK